MILTGENQRTGRTTYPSATLSTTNPTWAPLGANLASAVRSRRLTACAARPSPSLAYHYHNQQVKGGPDLSCYLASTSTSTMIRNKEYMGCPKSYATQP
jgi:hypothetical protein